MSDQVIVSTIPTCDLCKQRGATESAVIDGKTVYGPWANMCQSDFDMFGIGLGTGLGQRLVLAEPEPDKPAPGTVGAMLAARQQR